MNYYVVAGQTYGPFSVQEDGWPNAGEVVKSFRRLRKMSARRLGELYGEAIRQEPLSERWVHQLEHSNLVPCGITRRRALATVLSIPPILLGLGSLDELEGGAQRELVGLGSYETSLKLFWKLHYTSTARDYLPEIQANIGVLEKVARETGDRERLKLLCGYHYLYIDIVRDLRQYEIAFNHVNSVLEIGHELQDKEILATGLLRSAMTHDEKGNLLIAANMIGEALLLASSAQPQLRGCILERAGLVYARANKLNALTYLKQIEDIFAKGPVVEDGSYVNLSVPWYYQDQGRVYLDLHEPAKAIDSLERAGEMIQLDQPRRRIYIQIHLSRAYAAMGDTAFALDTAIQAAQDAKSLGSSHALWRLEELYAVLKKKRVVGLDDLRDALHAGVKKSKGDFAQDAMRHDL